MNYNNRDAGSARTTREIPDIQEFSAFENETAMQNYEKFENRVAALYAAAGYRTEVNIRVGGQQIDVIAEKTEMGSNIKLYIECKDYSNKVTNQEIQNALSSYISLKSAYKFTGCVIVGRSGISADGRAVASSNVEQSALSIEELTSHALGTTGYASLLNLKLKEDSVLKEYVNITVEEFSLAKDTNSNRKAVDIVDNVKKNPREIGRNIIFGDFGAGKTTLVKHCVWALSEKYVAGVSSFLPIHLTLNTVTEFSDFASFFDAQIRPFSSALRFQNVYDLVRNGTAVIFMDGLDEVATHATFEQRMFYLRPIFSFFFDARNVILTCRPSYFNNFTSFADFLCEFDDRIGRDFLEKLPVSPHSQARVERYVRAEQVMVASAVAPAEITDVGEGPNLWLMKDLTADEIVEFVKKFQTEFRILYNKRPDQICEKLGEIYDLSDLIKRPLLLRLICSVLLDEKYDLDDPQLDIGASAIYQAYVASHFRREVARSPGTSILTSNDRRIFAHGLALEMYNAGGLLEANLDQVLHVVEAALPKFTGSKLDYIQDHMGEVASELVVSSLITVDKRNNFRFVHKSFMEFFVADFIIDCLIDKGIPQILDRRLTGEITYFIGSFGFRNDQVSNVILNCMNSAKIGSMRRKNLLNAFLQTDRRFENFPFKGHHAEGIPIQRKSFYNCVFQDFRFVDCRIVDCAFEGGSFWETKFEGVEFLRSHFTKVKGRMSGTISSARSKFVGLSIDVWPGSRFMEDHFSECKLGVTGDSKVTDCHILNCEIFLREGNIEISSSKLASCVIRTEEEEPKGGNIRGCEFEDCKFTNLTLNSSEFSSFKNCRFKGCRGVIWFRSDKKKDDKFDLNKVEGEVFWQKGSVVALNRALSKKLSRSLFLDAVRLSEGEIDRKSFKIGVLQAIGQSQDSSKKAIASAIGKIH